MLAAEAALARARGQEELAGAIAAAPQLDPRELGERAAESGNPVVPLVEALRARRRARRSTAARRARTSSTPALMLVARDALALVREDLGARRGRRRAARGGAPRDADDRPDADAAGRADDVRAEGRGLDARARRGRARGSAAFRPAAQLGGPAGTLDGLGPEVAARYAAALGLEEPVLPWHTERIADRASSRPRSASPAARSPRRRATSSCSRRPRSARSARPRPAARPRCRTSATRSPRSRRGRARGRRPGSSRPCSPAMEQEHERAAGAWHAEWAPLRALLVATGSAAAWLRTCLEGLEVDAERMRANLGRARRRRRGRERRRARRPRALRPAGGVARDGRQRLLGGEAVAINVTRRSTAAEADTCDSRPERPTREADSVRPSDVRGGGEPPTPRRPARPTGRRRRACRRPRARRSAP